MGINKKVNASFALNAGALYFVIFLLFLMTILLATFILFIHYKNQLLIRQVGISQLEQNIESAIELYSVKPEILNKKTDASIDILHDTPSNVKITEDFWGVYRIVSFTGNYKQIERTKLTLFGFKYGSIKPTALYMTDKDRYLSVCGKSKVIGDCYLPKLGMRTARIEGKLFDGSIENREGFIHQSGKELPPPPEHLIENCKSILKGDSKGIIKRSEALTGAKQIFNSFTDSLTIYASSIKFWRLENININGKVVLYSNDEIYINPSVKLNNVIVVGRKVVVKNGFEGCVQIFASDTVILEENVRLLYPSNVSVIDSKSTQKFILVSQNSEVQGAVWIWNPNDSNEYLPVIKLEPGSKVKGQVYSPGKIQLKGEIWGTLMADLFFLNTPNALYENYIFNSSIDGERLPGEFACLPLVFDYNEMQFIDWLY